MRAARQGKEVTVVVELMARFDEEANINWASRWRRSAPTSCTACSASRPTPRCDGGAARGGEGGKGGSALRRYVHLGTGNYHPRTARLYTDFGLLTCNETLCADVNEVFKQLTGLGKASKLNHLLLAPFTLHDAMLAAIRAKPPTPAPASACASSPR
jgi:polyphosphate kinase